MIYCDAANFIRIILNKEFLYIRVTTIMLKVESSRSSLFKFPSISSKISSCPCFQGIEKLHLHWQSVHQRERSRGQNLVLYENTRLNLNTDKSYHFKSIDDTFVWPALHDRYFPVFLMPQKYFLSNQPWTVPTVDNVKPRYHQYVICLYLY